MIETNIIHQGNAELILAGLPDKSVNMCVTSPPYYGLRNYGIDEQIGLEQTPEEYIARLVNVFRGVYRVMAGDGTLWLNIGDSYWGGKGQSGAARPDNLKNRETINFEAQQMGVKGKTKPGDGKHPVIKPKDLIGIPWMLALALRADGWYLRQDIIWSKPNPMPESVGDRCTKAHEYLFLLTKSPKYYYDAEAIKEKMQVDWGTRNRDGGKYHVEGFGLAPHGGLDKSYEYANKRSVWSIPPASYKGAHFATFPPELVIPCILAGSRGGGIVLDPFMGSGTTAAVAIELGRKYVGVELNPDYIKLANKRIAATNPPLPNIF